MYKRHIITIILLGLAAVAFVLQFCLAEEWRVYCDIVAFVLPTAAAFVEIYLSEKSGKEMVTKIKKLEENQLSVHVEGETLYFDNGI